MSQLTAWLPSNRSMPQNEASASPSSDVKALSFLRLPGCRGLLLCSGILNGHDEISVYSAIRDKPKLKPIIQWDAWQLLLKRGVTLSKPTDRLFQPTRLPHFINLQRRMLELHVANTRRAF